MPGQEKKEKAADGEGGEAEAPPPDTRSWIQVGILHCPWADFVSLCRLCPSRVKAQV